MLNLSALKQDATPFFRRASLLADLPFVFRTLKYRGIRRNFYREYWCQAATDIGAEWEDLGGGWYRITRQGLHTFVRDHQLMLDSALMLDLMGDKAKTLSLLKGLGRLLPASCAFSVRDMKPARDLLETHGRIVVKPSFGTGGGRGVTTGVETEEALLDAARYAARFSGKLVAEEQVTGHNYRLLYLNGQFIDAVRRDPPTVFGDGTSSIRQLINRENRARLESSPALALSPLVVDRDARLYMKKNGLSLGTRPASGAKVQIKQAINENNRFGNWAVGETVSEHIRISCGKICSALGVQLAGVDLYCHDITGPFHPDNCTIGEINTTPGLHHHVLVANPMKSEPVAERILDLMFHNRNGVMETITGIGIEGVRTFDNAVKRKKANRKSNAHV